MPVTLKEIKEIHGDEIETLYKEQVCEPFGESSVGHGYEGVVLYDKGKKKLQCSLCGEWYKQLSQHISQFHDVSVGDYKFRFGLAKSTHLSSPDISRKISKAKRRYWTAERRKLASERKLEEYRTWERDKPKTPSPRTPEQDRMMKAAWEIQKEGRRMPSSKNKEGLCDAQINSRLEVVAATVGKEVSDLAHKDILAIDRLLLSNRTLKELKDHYSAVLTPKRAGIISALRVFVDKNNRIPIAEDFADFGLPDINEILNEFGSYRRAVIASGLYKMKA